jgi:hypothetical protein
LEELMAFNPKDGTIGLMLEFNIPITRETYLGCAGLRPGQELDGEIAEELAESIGNLLPDAPPYEN